MGYRVFTTEFFEESFHKLPGDVKLRISKLVDKLAKNPFSGKPLGSKFIREKKLKERRIYYLVFDDVLVVLLTALGDKKDQVDTINNLKINFSEYRDYVNKVIKDLD